MLLPSSAHITSDIAPAWETPSPQPGGFRAGFNKLLPVENRKGLGVIGMKIPARGRLFREGGITSMKDAMSYVLTLPVSTVIVGCDNVRQLEENVEIAKGFSPLPKEKMARLEELAAGYANQGSFYKRGAAGFAGPGTHAQWEDGRIGP